MRLKAALQPTAHWTPMLDLTEPPGEGARHSNPLTWPAAAGRRHKSHDSLARGDDGRQGLERVDDCLHLAGHEGRGGDRAGDGVKHPHLRKGGWERGGVEGGREKGGKEEAERRRGVCRGTDQGCADVSTLTILN